MVSVLESWTGVWGRYEHVRLKEDDLDIPVQLLSFFRYLQLFPFFLYSSFSLRFLCSQAIGNIE